MTDIQAEGRTRITGRTVFALFAAFFLSVAAVNAVFIYFALTSFPGLETEDAYRKGLAYDRELEAAQAQRALGWQAALAWEPEGPARGRLVLRVTDRSGQPVSGLGVTASLRRPTQADADMSADLSEVNTGTYVENLNLSGSGNWDVRVQAVRPDGTPYRLRQRLVVP